MLARGDWTEKLLSNDASLKPKRDAECACRTGKGHRFIRIVGERRLAGGNSRRGAGYSDAGTFDLHEMHVFDTLNPGTCDGVANRLRDAIDMGAPSDIFGGNRRAESGTDRERSTVDRCRLRIADAEHAVMRAHHPFGATGKHAMDFADQVLRGLVQMPRQ